MNIILSSLFFLLFSNFIIIFYSISGYKVHRCNDSDTEVFLFKDDFGSYVFKFNKGNLYIKIIGKLLLKSEIKALLDSSIYFCNTFR